jgi:hypothetical protein
MYEMDYCDNANLDLFFPSYTQSQLDTVCISHFRACSCLAQTF